MEEVWLWMGLAMYIRQAPFPERQILTQGPGVQNLTASSGGDVFICKLNSAGNLVWAKHMGGPDGASGKAIAVDGSGNILITGSFLGTVDFDPDSLGEVNLTSAGGNDIFVCKIDAAGNLLWVRQLGGPDGAEGYSITTDASGNIYTTGVFSETADFNPDTLAQHNLSSAGSTDIFISKLDGMGHFIWAKQLGGASQDDCRSIVVDGSGNVYTTGYFQGIADFDPDSAKQYNLSAGSHNTTFVSKLDTDGDFKWAIQFKGGLGSDGTAIDVDATGNVFTTGFFSGTVDFNPDSLAQSNLIGNSLDIFVSKLSPSGHYIWAKQLGGGASDLAFGIAVQGDDVYTTGFFSGTADFDPDSLSQALLKSTGANDVFISRLDLSGAFVWARQLGEPSGANAYSIAVDGSENVYTTGDFSGTSDFDPGPDTLALVSFGSADIFVHKMSDAVGIAKYPTENHFKLYPNPTQGVLTLEIGGTTQNVEVQVVNMMGQVLLNNTYRSTTKIDLTIPGPRGIYLVTVKKQEGRSETFKVVKD